MGKNKSRKIGQKNIPSKKGMKLTKDKDTVLNNIKKKIKSKKVSEYYSSSSSDEDYSDLENEPPKDYKVGGYHPVNLLDTIESRYMVVKKLGWGHFSTVWLCYDLEKRSFVALKIQKSKQNYTDTAIEEIKINKVISENIKDSNCVMKLFNSFSIMGPHGKHICLVFEVLGDNLLSMIEENETGVSMNLIKLIAKDILTGLNTIHKKNIMHTDIKPENICFVKIKQEILDEMKNFKAPPKKGIPLEQRSDIENLSKSQMKKLTKRLKEFELKGIDPPPKIEIQPCNFIPPKRSEIVSLCDFGNAEFTNSRLPDDVATRQYKAPEIIVGYKYSTPIDIWATACVLFELATGEYLFDPQETKKFSRDEDHLALMIESLGDIPKILTGNGKYSRDYFNHDGTLQNIKKLKRRSLFETLVEKFNFNIQIAREFTAFLLPMLEFLPHKRITAEEALKSDWLTLKKLTKESTSKNDDITIEIIKFTKKLKETSINKLYNEKVFNDELNNLKKQILKMENLNKENF